MVFSMTLGEASAAWLSRLVQIPSVSPEQAGPRAGEPGEGRLAAAVAGWFSDLGGDVQIVEVLPGRPNVFGRWRGQQERWLAVDVHLDTVDVEQMRDAPFSGHHAEGRVYGRGAVDTKASLAIILALLGEMQRTGQRPLANLLIAATVDEEVGATGAPAAAGWLRAQGLSIDELIVAEPTRCIPIHGHKGVVRLTFAVQGKAAHSSQPQGGQNAVIAAARLALALQGEHERLQLAAPAGLGHPALTVTILQGGTGINVVPDACLLALDRRVVETERAAAVVADLEALAQKACPLPFTMQVQKEIDAFYQPAEALLIRQIVRWTGQTPAVAPYGTNAWAYTEVAHQCVVFGPGSIDQAHGAEEWVEVTELARAAAVYARWWGLP